MVRYFSTFEEAALFAAYRRNEGYFAEVCDDSVSRLWGPLAVGGCRVISSDTQGEDRADPPGPGKFESFLLGLMRALTLAVFVIGIVVLGYRVGAVVRTLEPQTIFVAFLAFAGIVAGTTALSAWLANMVTASRDSANDPSASGAHVFAGFLAALAALLFFLILFRELFWG